MPTILWVRTLIDLGFSTHVEDTEEFRNFPVEKKIELVTSIICELGKQQEILLIDDWRSIVQFGGVYADWFLEVCKALPSNRIYMCVAAGSSPDGRLYRRNDRLFHLRLPELDSEERLGLLVRFLREVEDIHDVQRDDLAKFKNILNGYPEQAIYAGELIRDRGAAAALDQSHEIVDFSRLKASFYIENIEMTLINLSFSHSLAGLSSFQQN